MSNLNKDHLLGRIESLTPAQVINEAFNIFNTITLSPPQAAELLGKRIQQLKNLEAEGTLDNNVLLDEEYALLEIAQGQTEQIFGTIYSKYHVSSVNEPLVAGVKEMSLARELSDLSDQPT